MRLELKELRLSAFIALSVLVPSASATNPKSLCSVLLGEKSEAASVSQQSYLARVSADNSSISGHRMGTSEAQSVIYPSTAYWDAIFSAAVQNPQSKDYPVAVFQNTVLSKHVFILPEAKADGTPAQEFKLQTQFEVSDDRSFKFFINSSRKENDSKLRFEGNGRYANSIVPPSDFQLDKNRPIEAVDSQNFYSNLASRGLAYGKSYQGLKNIQVQGDQARAQILLSPTPDFSAHALPPAVLDNALHAVAAILVSNQKGWEIPKNEAAIPISFGSLEYNSQIKITSSDALYVNATIRSVTKVPGEALRITYDVLLTNGVGEVIVCIRDGVLNSARLVRDK